MRIALPCLVAFCVATAAVGKDAPSRTRLSTSDVLMAAMEIDAALDALVKSRRDQELTLLDDSFRSHPDWMTPDQYDRKRAQIEVDSAIPERASDEVFVRRAHLDITGCIPTAEETMAFLKDSDAGKRHKLVDSLLVDPRHARYLFNHLSSLLRLKDDVLGSSQAEYVAWVRRAAEMDMPYDQFVRSLLTASGSIESNPATGFYFRDQGSLFDTVEETLGAWLNIDMSCARCHDHPFSDLTQRQYFEMAAIFGKTVVERVNKKSGAKRTLWPDADGKAAQTEALSKGESLQVRDIDSGGVRLPSNYKYRDAEPGSLVEAAGVPIMSGPKVSRQWRMTTLSRAVDGARIRTEFANWLTSPDNPRFASSIAFSLWERAFGGRQRPMGTVETPDQDRRLKSDMHLCACDTLATWRARSEMDEPTIKGLIGALTRAMWIANYDLREYERIIFHTNAYQRDAVAFRPGEPLYVQGSPALRRMSPEQIWDSVAMLAQSSKATGYCHASGLIRQLPESHLLRQLGGGRHEVAFDSRAIVGYDTTLAMMNAEMPKRISSDSGGLVTMLRHRWPDSLEGRVDHAFLSILSRHPSEKEAAQAREMLSDDMKGTSDLVWALVNTSEFLFSK